MKRIKDILDFIITLVTAWKVVLPVLLVVLSAIWAVLKYGRISITITLPVWVLLIIGVLAGYPLVKFVEYFFKHNRTSDIALYKLLWRAPLLPSRPPIALCPRKDCGRQVICKVIPPQPYRVVSTISEMNNTRFENRYVYECPVHGEIAGVPNEEPSLLREKAKLAMRK
jgi:hypothetical protein